MSTEKKLDVRQNITTKIINKAGHIKEGNKTASTITLGWWNDKRAQHQKAVTVRDRLSLTLDKNSINVIGISE